MKENDDGQPSDSDSTSVGLLDLIGIAADAWLLLLLAPLAAGIIAYAAVSLQPTRFLASATVELNRPTSSTALRSIIDNEIGANPKRAIVLASGSASATIRVVAPEADAAVAEVRAAAGALHDQRALSPSEIELQTFALELDQERLLNLQGLRSRVMAASATALDEDAAEFSYGETIDAAIALSEQVASLALSNETRRLEIESPLTTSPHPTVNVEQVQKRAPALPVITAMAFTALSIYLLAFLWDRWQVATRSPRAAPKVDRIRRAFWMRAR